MKKESCVTVVTITEETPVHVFESHVEVFSDMEKAAAWIDGEIDRLVAEYKLDREKQIDGWTVHLSKEDYSHMIQYTCEEVAVR